MERIAGFAWHLPRAFAGAVSSCRFEQGDVLYRDAAGYADRWPEPGPPVPLIQVQEPAKAARALAPEAEGNRFEASWETPVMLELHRAAGERAERLASTQGRLFSCLWRGGLEWLAMDVAAPAPPLGVRELHRRLAEAVPACDARLARAAAGQRSLLLLVAQDDASEASRQKAHAIESVLREAFAVEAASLAPAEAGVGGADVLHPALLVRAMALATGDPQVVEQKLAGLLYGGAGGTAGASGASGESKASRFSLSRHALLVERAQA
jgi:hypothetical protein